MYNIPINTIQYKIFLFRFDERLLIIFGGVVSMLISTIFFMPIPGNDNTHICNETEYLLSRSPFLSSYGGLGERIKCSESQAIGCCALEWCKEQPAMNIGQFIIGFCIFAAGHPFRLSITQSLFTKILGPIQQVMKTKTKC